MYMEWLLLVRTLHIDQYQYWWINLALCVLGIEVLVKKWYWSTFSNKTDCFSNKGGCGMRIAKFLKEDLTAAVEKELRLGTTTSTYFKKLLLHTQVEYKAVLK